MNEQMGFLNPTHFELAASTPQQATPKEVPWWDDAGIKVVEGLEAFRSRAYKDSKGIPTIGHGFIKHPLTGKKVKTGDVISYKDSANAVKANMKKFDESMSKKYASYREFLDPRGKAALFSLLHNQTNDYSSIEQFPRLHEIMSMEVRDEGQTIDFDKRFVNEIRHWGDTKDPELIPRRRAEVWFYETGELKDQGWFKKSDKPEK